VSWSRLNLGAADLATPALEDVRRTVEAAWCRAGRPRGMEALFRHESERRLHCELVVYFSPAAASVAQSLGARPCTPPGRHDLAHLAGGDHGDGAAD
jgi:hypothetical protein